MFFGRSQDQVGDIFTKALNKEKLEKFKTLLKVANNKINIKGLLEKLM